MSNPFAGATESQCLDFRDALWKRQTAGALHFIIAAGMQQMRSFQNSKAPDILLRYVMLRLHEINPEEYPHPGANRVRRTLPSYV